MKSKTGSILIITLWALSLLSIFAVSLGHNIASQLRLADHLQDRLKMYYLAKAGIERAIIEVVDNDETPNYDSLNEIWANSEEFFKEVPLGDGYVTVSYRIMNGVEQEGKEDEEVYGIMDESSKININKASAEILGVLLERVGELERDEAIDIANAIIDWRDVDIITSPGGAENKYYKNLKLSYECKNEKFQVIEELLLIKGMSPEIFSKIKDIITIYGEDKVNINTASFTTLYGLGLSKDLAERIIEFRQGSDGETGTEDDKIFKTIGELKSIGPLFRGESNQIDQLISLNMLTVRSDVFRINSSGILKRGKQQWQRSIVCIVKRQVKGTAQLIHWHEE